MSLKVNTRDEAEAALAVIVALQVQLAAVAAEQNAALLAVRGHDAKIGDLRERLNRYTCALGEWAKVNRAELGEKKSLEMRHGTIGFKLGNRAVQFLEGWTDKLVLEQMRKARRVWSEYIRVKEEIDKQRILANSRPEAARRLKEERLEKIGLAIAQTEFFYITPKTESAEATA